MPYIFQVIDVSSVVLLLVADLLFFMTYCCVSCIIFCWVAMISFQLMVLINGKPEYRAKSESDIYSLELNFCFLCFQFEEVMKPCLIY